MPLELPRATPCPFCDYLAGTTPCAFVHRGATVSTFVNRAQYERGALLVVPNEHVGSLLDLSEPVLADIYCEAQRLAHLLADRLGATGVNVFQNNGIAAGQSVPHFHVHVVPRYATSDPGRRFREADFDVTPIEELQRLAAELSR
jgi:histidine triad (HIT) family protein